MDELEEAELEVETLFLAISEFVEGAEHDGEEAGEVFFGEEGGGARRAVALLGGNLRRSAAIPVASASGARPVTLATMVLRR